MESKIILPQRRSFIQKTFLGAASVATAMYFDTPGLFAEELITPTMTDGPFYPDKLPLDTDNDLLVLNDRITPAVGEITHFHGQVSDIKGNPVRNAVVEIWQVDNNGVYLHKEGGPRNKLDKNFQGFGRFTTNVKGEYYFRTIKPVTYPGRTPHIHVKVYTNGQARLSTQALIKGDKRNDRDGLFRQIRDPKQRDMLLVDYQPLPNSKIGELTARFDIVLGITPDENQPARRTRG